ncbi:MAG TPA: ABC transporter permease [Pseudonocardiaceae bacterium]|jgi:ABC-2 type transport system permease protein|nr:ABC transporter permease [Pseudonocardiaceae bacterium]
MNRRVFAVELLDELRGIVREPTALLFSVLMPVGLFAMFVGIFGRDASGGLSGGTSMLATFGTYGVIVVTMMNPGIGVAQDRERGWLRAKQVSAVPITLTLAAKVVAALTYAFGVLAAMAATAAALGVLDTSAGALVRLGAVLLLGSFPFALLGLAVGFQARAGASAAILNAVLMPAAVLSGLWLPLAILPAFFQQIARFLPTYHLAELARAQLAGGEILPHISVLVATTLVAAGLAAVAYRRART